jgi:Cytidylyltransferase
MNMRSDSRYSTTHVNPKILAIIPARGGSKRIPRKNIVDLCGKPLIAYSIEVALKTPQVSRVIVSTEDKEIAEIARAHGAEVPFYRPMGMARDSSVLGDAVDFTLDRLGEDGYKPDVVFELYPTSVFRTPKQLSFLIGKLLEGYSSVKTVKPIPVGRASLFTIKKDGSCMAAVPVGLGANGSKRVFFKSYGLFVGRNLNRTQPYAFYLHKLIDPISLIDIDYPHDLCMAEEIIRRNLFDFDQK